MTTDTICLITKPSVYLVGRQALDGGELADFLDDDGLVWESDADNDAAALVETAGRLCYMSYANPRPGGNDAYIAHIIEAGHGSVLEHAVWNFAITGVSRSLTHELVRHRVGFSFSQLSQRYVDESDAGFIVPHALRPAIEAMYQADADAARGWHGVTTPAMEAARQWIASLRTARATYAALCEHLTASGLNRKMARQAARSVLPNATETKIFVTANARALRHFIELRGSRHADAEIRQLAVILLGVLQREAPTIFADYVVREDG